MLSRYLLRIAEDHASQSQEVAAFAAISMLQDALETFLVAATDFLNASVNPRTDFSGYLDKINDKLPDGQELPFRRRLIEINKVRVLAKHDGARPDSKELLGYALDTRSFLEEATKTIFGVDFWTISLVSLLNDGEPKSYLLEAISAFDNADYAECLVAVRKAFYLEFEKDYDVKKFENGVPENFLLAASSAPYYAQNAEYVSENVMEPFDYIVLNHSQVEAEISKLRIDHPVFWNIWRLTPSVYRHNPDDEWLIKAEPEKNDEAGLKDRAAYVLEGATDCILKKHTSLKSSKWINNSYAFYVKPKRDAALYKKADVTSEVVSRIPKGIDRVSVGYGTPGLSGGFFWRVLEFLEANEDTPAGYLHGYISEDDVVRE